MAIYTRLWGLGVTGLRRRGGERRPARSDPVHRLTVRMQML